jgi:twitching motility protein PilT
MAEPNSNDFLQELLTLAGSGQAFSDIHLEQDAQAMIKTPRGWQPFRDAPVSLKEMTPFLQAVDEDWEDRIVDRALDRPLTLPNCRLRCNVYRMGAGSKVGVSVRRLPLLPMSLESTGLPSYVRTLLDAANGLILVAGPTGSGKTTSIAAMLDYINGLRNGHIVTIEEPIEYVLQRKRSIISQKEVPTDTASFASGLREALRQKPDVLMVGEIRDYDTAETVLHAAESGHLVLATLHTSHAVGAITKLLGFFPAEQREQRATALANALVGVIFQGLLPSESGKDFVLASEMIFNNNQQLAPFISTPGKLHLIAEFMKRKEDNMSRSLNDALAQLVGKKAVNARDAMRIAYNRLELHEMLGNLR